jgi:hypothetical protein
VPDNPATTMRIDTQADTQVYILPPLATPQKEGLHGTGTTEKICQNV